MKIVIELEEEEELKYLKLIAREMAPLIRPPEEGRLIGRKELERKLNTKNDKKFKEITSRPDFPKNEIDQKRSCPVVQQGSRRISRKTIKFILKDFGRSILKGGD